MSIIDLYKDILSTANLIADKDDNISASSRGVTIPFTINGKRLVLPTRQQLKNPDWSNRISFHPLNENIMGEESEVIDKFRNAINVRLNMVIGFLMTELLGIVTSVEIHKDLSPDQSELLTKIKDADSKTIDALTSILTNIFKDDKDKRIVHLFIKRGGTVGASRFTKATIVTFPLYKELKTKEKQVYGVTLRNRDKEAIISLLEYIIPGIDVDNMFSTGSLSDIAPSLESLMKALMKIASRTNIVAKDYAQFMADDAKDYIYSDTWVEYINNLSQLEGEIRSIPMLPGNDGKKNQPFVPPLPEQQTLRVAPPVTGYVGPLDVPTHPPYNQTFIQPTQSYPAPVVAPPNQQLNVGPKGQVFTENGGIDFAATVRNNPSLVGMNTGMQPGMHNQQLINGPMALRAGGAAYNQGMQQPMYPQQGYQNPQQQQWNPQQGYQNPQNQWNPQPQSWTQPQQGYQQPQQMYQQPQRTFGNI